MDDRGLRLKRKQDILSGCWMNTWEMSMSAIWIHYEPLYLNQNACETLGVPIEKVLGRKCYEVIQGRTSPCPFARMTV